MASGNTDLVVNAYIHAVKARWSHPRYQVGYDAKLFYIPLSMLPTRIQDMAFKIISILTKPPLPKKIGSELF